MKDLGSHLVFRGGEVKALGNGKVGGYLVVFGDEENTDLTALRDFFTAETDFGIEAGAKTAIWYRHALDPALDRIIGEGAMKVDEVGVWVDGQLDLRDKYVKAVYGMAEKKALGWSSGTAVHLVKREAKENGAHEIKRWPLGLDASLTPDPAEPRTQAMALKSVQWQAKPLEELVAPAVKAIHLGEWLEEDMTFAAVSRLNDALMYRVVYRCIDDDELTPEQRRAKLREAVNEFGEILIRTVDALMEGAAGEDAVSAMKSIRALWADPDAPSTTCRLPVGLTFEQHSQAVLGAAKALCERAQGVKDLRAAKNQPLSEARRADAKELSELFAVLAETGADVTPTLAAKSDVELLRQQVLDTLALTGH